MLVISKSRIPKIFVLSWNDKSILILQRALPLENPKVDGELLKGPSPPLPALNSRLDTTNHCGDDEIASEAHHDKPHLVISTPSSLEWRRLFLSRGSTQQRKLNRMALLWIYISYTYYSYFYASVRNVLTSSSSDDRTVGSELLPSTETLLLGWKETNTHKIKIVCLAKESRIPVTYCTCDLLFWLVTLFR